MSFYDHHIPERAPIVTNILSYHNYFSTHIE